MHFHDLHSFLAMGGYAQYVWPVYGLALAIFTGLGLYNRYQQRRLLKELSDEQNS